MKGTVVGGNYARVEDVPLPQFDPSSNQLYFKVHYASQNPKDWKGHTMFNLKPCVEGSDAAGVVEKVGEKAKELGFKIGDRVAAMMPVGAFAEYAVGQANSAFKIPDNVSFEEACTVPLAAMTAYMVLFRWLNFPLPNLDQSTTTTKKTPFVIYGASSSVGIFAVQLAKLANLRVIAIAGRSLPYVKTFLDKDDVAVDYRAPNFIEQVKEATGEPLLYALDAISDLKTTEIVAKVLSPGGKVSVVFPISPDFNVPSISIVPFITVFVTYGVQVRLEREGADPLVFPVDIEESIFAQKGFQLFTKLMEEGKLNGVRATLMGGLEGVEKGLEKMQNGDVSGEKYVYKIL